MKKVSKRNLMIICGVALIAMVPFMVGCFGGVRNAEMLSGYGELRIAGDFYSYSGTIEARNRQNVVAMSSGVAVSTVHVRAGDWVNAGDLLVTFEARDARNNVTSARAAVDIARAGYANARGAGQAAALSQVRTALAQAEASYRDARANLERMQALFESGAVSQVQLEQAQTAFNHANSQLGQAIVSVETASEGAGHGVAVARAQYEQARAALDNAQYALDNRVIRAEMSGVVAAVHVRANDRPMMGERVIDVIDSSDLLVDIRVDEYEIEKFYEGMAVEVHVSALGRSVRGYVSQISYQALSMGEDLVYFLVEVQLAETYGVRAGMMSEIRTTP